MFSNQAQTRPGPSSGIHRPQDVNRSFRRQQINVNIGPSQLYPQDGYSEKVRAAITKKIQIKEVCSENWHYQTSMYVDNEERFKRMMDDIMTEQIVALDYEFHTEDAFTGKLAF